MHCTSYDVYKEQLYGGLVGLSTKTNHISQTGRRGWFTMSRGALSFALPFQSAEFFSVERQGKGQGALFDPLFLSVAKGWG